MKNITLFIVASAYGALLSQHKSYRGKTHVHNLCEQLSTGKAALLVKTLINNLYYPAFLSVIEYQNLS